MTRPESVPNPDPGSDSDSASALPASRRAFIAGAGAVTIAGAAAVAVGTAAGSAATAAAAAVVTTAPEDADSTGPSGAVVAYVRDLTTGEVRVMSGEREVVVHDRALARSLARHADSHLENREG